MCCGAGSPTFSEANQGDVARRCRGLGLPALEPDAPRHRVTTAPQALLRGELLLGRAAMLGGCAGQGVPAGAARA